MSNRVFRSRRIIRSAHVGKHYLQPQKYPMEKGIPCEASAGDVLFFNYLTIHGSNVNRSERPRRNILIQYRDPEDRPTADIHISWGQGLMVGGINPRFRNYTYTGALTEA